MFIKQKISKQTILATKLCDFAISRNATLFVQIRLNKLLPWVFLYTFTGCFARKKMGKLRDEILQLFVEMSWNKLLLFQKKNYLSK